MTNAVDRLQVPGQQREEALKRFYRQMAAWGMAVPQVEPLVMDFGLGDFDRAGLIEYWLANETQAGYCGKYLFTFDGQRCPAHSHRVKHETFYPLQGRFRVTLDGRTMTLVPGQVLPIAPGRVHTFEGDGNALLLELSTPCDVADNQFQDPRVMDWLRRCVR